jgi:hypothetical protein
VLFDVALLPADIARRIAAFVKNGGVVIADCVPGVDAYKEPMTVMEELFGVNNAQTNRVRRTGHWVPRVTAKPYWFGKQAPDESNLTTDAVQGTALGQPLDLTLVSPRRVTVTTGEVLLRTATGQPAIVGRRVGKGRVFMLGFCLQDTYFKTWQDDKPAVREQLAGLLHGMTETAGVQAHVRSSNQDIEASLRAGAAEGFLFLIHHEASAPDTVIRLTDFGFKIGHVVDLADGQSIPFTKKEGVVELALSAPLGQTRLFHVARK